MKMVYSERQSNFELLRTVSMLLIVAWHFSMEAFWIPDNEPVTFNVLYLHFIGFGGRLGVDLFVLISGYFMVNQRFRGRKVLRLWLHCLFVPGFFGLIALALGRTGIRELLGVLVTPINNSYWFVTTYFLLYLLSGYINAMIRAVSRRALLGIIVILAAVYTVFPTFLALRLDGSTLMFFILLYLIAAYIRLYSPKILESRWGLAAGAAFHLGCNLFSCVLLSLREAMPLLGHIGQRMSQMTDTTVVISAVLIFCGFKNLKIRYSKGINLFGAASFGVYLVHSNPFTDHLLWVGMMKSPEYLYSSRLVLFSAAAIAAEYAIGVGADLAYSLGLEERLMKIADRAAEGMRERRNAVRRV